MKNHPFTETSLFIGDISEEITEEQIKEDLCKHVKGCENIREYKLCPNFNTGRNMFFFVVTDYDTLKALIIHPIIICGTEHYCQISQKWGEAEDFDFQKRCIFISNVSFSVKDADIRGFFYKFGDVESGYLVKKNGKSKGYGFVYFKRKRIVRKLVRIGKLAFRGKDVFIKAYKQKTKIEAKQGNPGSQGNLGYFQQGNAPMPYGGGAPRAGFMPNFDPSNPQSNVFYELLLQNFILQAQLQQAYGQKMIENRQGFMPQECKGIPQAAPIAPSQQVTATPKDEPQTPREIIPEVIPKTHAPEISRGFLRKSELGTGTLKEIVGVSQAIFYYQRHSDSNLRLNKKTKKIKKKRRNKRKKRSKKALRI